MYRDNEPIYRVLQGRNRHRYGQNAIGMEIEIETTPAMNVFNGHPRMPPDWVTHEDGSLAMGGVEFVLARPFTMEHLPEKVRSLVDFCATEMPPEASFQISKRTSTHYHLNVEHKTPAEFLTQYLGFLIIEPMLVASQRYRDSNLFCLPTWLADSAVRDLTQRLRFGVGNSSFYGNDVLEWLRVEHAQNRRYRAINTVSTARGSLEFRCFESSLDPDVLLHWPKMLLDILDKTNSLPIHTLRHMLGTGEVIDWTSDWAMQSDIMRPKIDQARSYWTADYQDTLYQCCITACSYLDRLKTQPEATAQPIPSNPNGGIARRRVNPLLNAGDWDPEPDNFHDEPDDSDYDETRAEWEQRMAEEEELRQHDAALGEALRRIQETNEAPTTATAPFEETDLERARRLLNSATLWPTQVVDFNESDLTTLTVVSPERTR